MVVFVDSSFKMTGRLKFVARSFFYTKSQASLRKNSLLWKIELDGLPGTSYIFGTMHVRDQRAFQRLGRVYEAVEACEGYAAEFHLEEAGSGIQASVMQLPDGQRISDFVLKKEFDRQRRVLLKSTGIDLAQFDRMLPFMVVNLATENLLGQEMPEALDQHLWAFAKKREKALHGIETLQEQMEVLGKISLEAQVKMLAGLCKNIGRFRQYLLRLAELYEASEVQQLYKMVKKNSRELRGLMLYRRNEIMAERIGALVKGQTIFVAIGAAHLSGGKGVLRLLKKQGLKISPAQLIDKQ